MKIYNQGCKLWWAALNLKRLMSAVVIRPKNPDYPNDVDWAALAFTCFDDDVDSPKTSIGMAAFF